MKALTSSIVFGLVSAATLTGGGFAVRQFLQISVPPLPVTSQMACTTLQESRGQARWDAPGKDGYLYGDGSLLLQQCLQGVWDIHVRATPMYGEPPHLLIMRGGQQIFDQDVEGTRSLAVSVKVGQTVVLVAPNTRIVLEDRNLYIRRFHFNPDVPCLQNPPIFSTPDVGVSTYGQFALLSNGSVLFTACGHGEVFFQLEGTEEAGKGPVAQVQVNNQTRFSGVILSSSPVNIKTTLEKGQVLRVTFSNDASRQINQRLIQVERAAFTPSP